MPAPFRTRQSHWNTYWGFFLWSTHLVQQAWLSARQKSKSVRYEPETAKLHRRHKRLISEIWPTSWSSEGQRTAQKVPIPARVCHWFAALARYKGSAPRSSCYANATISIIDATKYSILLNSWQHKIGHFWYTILEWRPQFHQSLSPPSITHPATPPSPATSCDLLRPSGHAATHSLKDTR